MRKSLFVAVLTLAAGTAVSPLLAMGGGGYGGGSMGTMSGPMQGDDYGMALRLIHQDRFAHAIPYLMRELRRRPHSADVLNYLGFTSRMVGNFQNSLIFYQHALQENPDHKGAHEYLGELYLNMHDLASAQGQLAELVRICPTDCDERDTLTKSIATYVAANPQPAPAIVPPTTAPPTQPSGTN